MKMPPEFGFANAAGLREFVRSNVGNFGGLDGSLAVSWVGADWYRRPALKWD